MKQFFRYLFGFIVLGIGVVLAPNVGAIEESELSATINSQDPASSRLVLKNNSPAACQIATTAIGTVAITKVMQDGKEIKPAPLEVAFEDGLERTLPSQLKVLQTGESFDIPLHITKSGDAIGLQSVVWSRDGGALGMLYMVKPNTPLQVELNYSVPIDSSTNVPMCDAVLASNIDTTTGLWRGMLSLLLTVVIILACIVIVVLRYIHKKNSKKTPIAVLVAISGLATLGLFSQPVYAQVTVPDSVRGNWDACMATLEANRDITGPILDIINNPSIRIIIDPRSTGGASMAAWPDGTYHIDWNVNDRHAYAGTGGNADPCTSIYHELYHILDMENRTFSRDDCAGSGIEIKEVMAVRAQNELRVRLGMPARSHYGETPVPAGDCRVTATPPPCRGTGCARSTGDPHLRTFDGRHYDFQAAGEFVLAKATNTPLEIQVRQEPWKDSRWVSINTAAVVKTGNHTIQVAPDGHKIGIVVDGKKQPIKSAELSGGDALAVMANQTRVDITSKDGTVVSLAGIGDYGIDVTVDPSDTLKGMVEGLLGNYDEKQDNDLRIRGKDTTIGADFSQLYPTYADSWRVNDKTSLFTYAKGKNTNTFTNRAFPYERFDAKSQPGYEAATIICKRMGITDKNSLADCALDVLVTGRPEFARSALKNQTVSLGSAGNAASYTLSAKNPGDIAKATFTAKKDEKIFIEVVSSTLPSLCSPISINDSEDKQLGNGCIINGKGHIETETMPTDGTYTLQLRAGDVGGDARVRLYRVIDQTGGVGLDGDAIKAAITTPGMQSRFTFSATAGQRLFVNATDATLPSQCSPVALLDPMGDSIASSCIINGKGNLDATAAKTGTYTLVVNPGDIATGSVKLHLTTSQIVAKSLRVGESATITLSKPGDVAEISFLGTAGRRLFVDISDSTLPGQCGGFTMHMPDGNDVNGCIIGSKSTLETGGVVLPANGTYVVRIDPPGANTGKFVIHLRH